MYNGNRISSLSITRNSYNYCQVLYPHLLQTLQGDAWHLAAELHKLELILNILTLGYSVAYVDVDTMFFRNPMPILLSSQVCPPQQLQGALPKPPRNESQYDCLPASRNTCGRGQIR